jgi:hypothetical protein
MELEAQFSNQFGVTMSEVPMQHHDLPDHAGKPLWPVAAVILALVFAPAVVAWVLQLIR